jgi:hypothetical protein
MSSTQRRAFPRALILIALALAGLALVAAANADAKPGPHARAGKHHRGERLVVRGEDTVKDAPCDASGCPLELTGGAFRGTLGTGAYSGAIKLDVAEMFANGEGGVCAPIRGRIVLGEGSPDRLVLGLRGDSCQDGKGPVKAASFTGVAEFAVVYGTGAYAHARGHGIGSFLEDAADREHITLVGRITRS